MSNSDNASLGNSTEFASPFFPVSSGKKASLNTVQRYYLQSLAKELLGNDHRIGVCMHCLSPVASSVDILKNENNNHAYYRGLMVCGLVWVCPVCAARITEERRQELTTALAKTDLQAILVTYTFKHRRGDNLAVILKQMTDAYRKMKSGKAWQTLQDEYLWHGSIKSLEVTLGDNGWHPHQHELVLLESTVKRGAIHALSADLKAKWLNALRKVGLDASWDYGLDVRTAGKDVKDYVAKFGHEPIVSGWTIEMELTKQPVKKGKKDGKSPLQLLSDYGDGDIKAGRMWREYAYAFKGKKQLVWSKGLRDELGMSPEVDDTAIAESLPDGLLLLASLNPQEWKAIIKADLRGEVLEAARSMDAVQFKRWLNSKLEDWI